MRLLLLALVATAPAALGAQARPDTSTLTARLGVDTISVERIIRTGNVIEAEVVTRSPRTTLQRQRAQFDARGNLTSLTVVDLNPTTGAETRTVRYMKHGDSLHITTQAAERTERMVAAPAEWLPFIDLVHWPFDVALRRLRSSGASTVGAPMLSGQRVSPFPLALIGRDSATVTHPTRGTMRLTVLPDGSIRTLDAGATTRALIVTRSGNSDVVALARDFANRDATGRGVGELSGRGGGETRVLGATFTLDYGVPMKRGRDIWGALVRYGQLWRTGANRATHFKTDTELRFGELVVPPGEYTLYSIPEATGGILIINRQTGQNGQQYDQARDLGRIPLRARPLANEVEAFTISVREENGRGLLALQWDRTEMVAEFAVTRR
ncbi:MAG: DUF2911 domain-containing protein [Gemmatimonadaceae bacterium]|nr:DUF2911 domain-containing protein [Gemmatimonadaceae bacterium]MCW5827574.1 DUF2911 domain-containing protein [Gemmatimonadaceae bacterium]